MNTIFQYLLSGEDRDTGSCLICRCSCQKNITPSHRDTSIIRAGYDHSSEIPTILILFIDLSIDTIKNKLTWVLHVSNCRTCVTSLDLKVKVVYTSNKSLNPMQNRNPSLLSIFKRISSVTRPLCIHSIEFSQNLAKIKLKRSRW